MRGLNLDQMAAFRAVAELGSFSAAADRLRLSQPAVSLQVRQLERWFGVRLIERLGRRVQPTAAGRSLLVHAAAIDGAVEAARQALLPHAEEATGRVRLGVGATACIYLLPPMLGSLKRRFPALEIIVRTGNTREIAQAVEENSLDVALVTLPLASRILEVTPVLEEEIVLAAPAGRADLPAKVTPQIAAALPLLLFEPGGNTRRVVDDWLALAQVTVEPVMALGSVEAIKRLVAEGLGCALLPSMALAVGEAGSSLAVRPLAPPLRRALAVVLRRDKPLGRGLREVVSALNGLGPDG